ncbi:hypothetical protein [Metabacillus sp. FJAT-53654]|uniref:Uncharacterized protein n=1 Tax=Metabacillus rhizosphaerae TaxID=3117747 RepID=A0ABZ2N104_9BACI
MNFRDDAKKCYEQSLRDIGISDKSIRIALAGFDTGFSAGMLNESSLQTKFEMLKKLLNQNVIH